MVPTGNGLRQKISIFSPKGDLLYSYGYQDYLRIMKVAGVKAADRELSWICFWSEDASANADEDLEISDVYGNSLSLDLNIGGLVILEEKKVCE